MVYKSIAGAAFKHKEVAKNDKDVSDITETGRNLQMSQLIQSLKLTDHPFSVYHSGIDHTYLIINTISEGHNFTTNIDPERIIDYTWHPALDIPLPDDMPWCQLDGIFWVGVLLGDSHYERDKHKSFSKTEGTIRRY